MLDTIRDILIACWVVLGQMAPWLLFGFLVAGILHVLVPQRWVQRHLGGRGLMPVVKSTLFGVPLPLCSCGVIPVTAGIRQQGASRGAASGFLIATPQTGVDSILATYALLGPVFAIVRPVVALISGIIGGGVIDWATRRQPDDTASAANAAGKAGNCCEGGACSTAGDDGATNTAPTATQRATEAARYGLVTLPGSIAVHLLFGLAVAGLLSVLIDAGKYESLLGGGLLAMCIMMLVGVPLYVCSTASIPLAVGFMHLGASPGAALVFLITGPATNAATIAVMWKLLGKRSTVIYLATIVVSALLAGWLLDLLMLNVPAVAPHADHVHADAVGWFNHVAAAALLVVLVVSIIARRRVKATASAPDATRQPQADQTLVLNIEGMTCSHCVATAADAIRSAPGVHDTTVELATGRAVVHGHDINRTSLTRAVEQVGFHASVAADATL